MDKPLYTFNEVIELLRWAATLDEVILIYEVIEEDLGLYPLFHVRLILEAVKQKKLYFQAHTGDY